MIAGTDLVNITIEPHEFYDFLGRRLTRSFVKDKEDPDHRLSEHTLGPDPDGLYRIEDFFCHDDTWQMTVSALVWKADIVLMDLRGFNCEKRGCAFEIEMLKLGRTPSAVQKKAGSEGISLKPTNQSRLTTGRSREASKTRR